MRPATCAPGRKRHPDTKSCFKMTELESLRKAWNRKHSHDTILQGGPAKVWKELRNKTKKHCASESCWARRPFTRNDIHAQSAFKRAHRPIAPKLWLKNPREWLSSDDIDQVMHQYEAVHPHFLYLGAPPIDFDRRDKREKGGCIWDKMCKLDLANELRRGKTQLAAIPNADEHDQDGSHWMTIYIDLQKGYILYFDSTGDPPTKEVKKFINRMKEQGKKLGIRFKVMINKKHHQHKNTECGVYGLFAVSGLLEGKLDPTTLISGKRIPDDAMYQFRKKFFNMPERESKIA